jgi:NADH-quinone oxidoreductase subunit C
MMESLDQIKARLLQALPAAAIEIVSNGSPSPQHSLLVDSAHLLEAARWLAMDQALRLDYLSNLTAIDWLDATLKEITRTREIIDGQERLIERTHETIRPGYFEVVYHLYSVELKHGPLVIRTRTADRSNNTRIPSVTAIWRGAEFQEREAYDLFGILFEGHPDLRRILMWEGFQDYPMRKDYVAPDDYEYEPTAHDDVLERARAHERKEAGK